MATGLLPPSGYKEIRDIYMLCEGGVFAKEERCTTHIPTRIYPFMPALTVQTDVTRRRINRR